MFSLIITIISIALVAVLVLATLYYGGDAFNRGSSDAQAAKIVNQGQQLLGAAEMFFVDNKRWPDDVAELRDGGYLKNIPVAALDGNGMVSLAQAASQWNMPVANQPVFVAAVDASGACKAVNKRTIGMDGILAQVHDSIITQCYGTSASALKAVVSKNPSAFAAIVAAPAQTVLPAADIASGAVPAWDATTGWLAGYEPSSASASSGGSTPPAGSCNFSVVTVDSNYATAWRVFQYNGTVPLSVTQVAAYWDGSSNVTVSRSTGPDSTSALLSTSSSSWTTPVGASFTLNPGDRILSQFSYGNQEPGSFSSALAIYSPDIDSWCGYAAGGAMASSTGTAWTLNGSLTPSTWSGSSGGSGGSGPVTPAGVLQASSSGTGAGTLFDPYRFLMPTSVGSSSTLTLTLTNTGTSTLNITGLTTADDTVLSVVGDDCGSPLTAGASCTVDILFAPEASGQADDRLLVTHDGTGPTEIFVRGSTGF